MQQELRKKLSLRKTKPTKKTCAASEDADQPANPRSLIRAFADCRRLLQSPGYPKEGQMRTLDKLSRCTGCYESFLVTQALLLIYHALAQSSRFDISIAIVH